MPVSRTLAALALIALAVVACGSSKASASATSVTSPITSLIPPITSGPSELPSGSRATGQTDTEWGRIWDSLPADFPAVAGSKASEEAATGPASATLVADGNVAKAAAAYFSSALGAAGYTVDGATSPLEDGSYVLDATGASGCQVQVSVGPTGGQTTIRVLYGAACPSP
jgi:hypothetical protein